MRRPFLLLGPAVASALLLAGSGLHAVRPTARLAPVEPTAPATTEATAPLELHQLDDGADDSAVEIAPVEVPAVPTEAAPPTTSTTAPAPAAAATASTVVAGTVQQRGAAALALISYPWQRSGYQVSFEAGRTGLLGLTTSADRTVHVYVRSGQTTASIARVVAHELGHVVDLAFTTESERSSYRSIRALGTGAWYPCSACEDFASPAGDFAEVFAWWLLGPGSFHSTAAGTPTQAQLDAAGPIFAAPAEGTTPTTAARRTTPSTTTPQSTTTPSRPTRGDGGSDGGGRGGRTDRGNDGGGRGGRGG